METQTVPEYPLLYYLSCTLLSGSPVLWALGKLHSFVLINHAEHLPICTSSQRGSSGQRGINDDCNLDAKNCPGRTNQEARNKVYSTNTNHMNTRGILDCIQMRNITRSMRTIVQLALSLLNRLLSSLLTVLFSYFTPSVCIL